MEAATPSPHSGRLLVFELLALEAKQGSPSVTSLQAKLWTHRDRLARELHDGVGQSINALLVQIRAALAAGEGGAEVLRVLEQEAENALQSLRMLAYGVRQRPASDPLDDARRYAERLLKAAGSVLRWVDERSNVRLTSSISKQLAWSIRESITNAVRHGSATTVEVRLREAGERIRVTVRDNGIGFSPETVRTTPDGRGLGLVGNAERMAEIGGTFNIRSRPGEGAVVLLEAPRRLHRSVANQSPSAPARSSDSAKELAAAGAL